MVFTISADNVKGQVSHAIFGHELFFTYLSKSGSVCALNGLNIKVPKSRIYGLLGPSGCGKTTLLKCIVGRYQPTRGTLKVFGCSPCDKDSGIPGSGVGYMPQELAVPDNLTIEETINYFGKLYFMQKSDIERRCDDLVALLELPEKNRLVQNLSLGQKRRVSFAATVVHEPRLMILDEPTVGVDPVLRKIIWDRLNEYACKGITVVVTTHYIEETRSADYVGFLRHGQLVVEDTPQNLMNSHSAKSLEQAFYFFFDSQKCVDHTRSISLASAETREPWEPAKSQHSISSWFSILFTVATKIVLQEFRNPGALITQFIIPLTSLLIYVTCVGPMPKGLNLAVVNEESPRDLSELYLRQLYDYRYAIKLVNYSKLEDAFQAAKSKHAFGVLHFKPNFTESLVDRVYNFEVAEDKLEQSTVTFHSDTTDRFIHVVILRFLEESFLRFMDDVKRELNISSTMLDLFIVSKAEEDTSEDMYYFSRAVYFWTVGTLFVITYTVAFATTILVVGVEKRSKIFDRNYVAGVSMPQILLAHLMVRFFFTTIVILLLFWQCVYVFEVPVNGSPILCLALLLLQGLTGLSQGLMLSTMFDSFFYLALFAQGILVSMFIVSGVLWPVDTMPYWLRSIVHLSPITVPVEALRKIILNAWDLTYPMVAYSFVLSIFWTIVFIIGAILLLKYTK